MPLHDMICDFCNEIYEDMPLYVEGTQCPCGGYFEIYWHARPRDAAAFGRDETTVVYEHPATGKVVYPGRNDQPMPARYEQAGYVRRELKSLHEVDTFSKEHGVVNEKANYNSGNSINDGKR